jgi:anti-anti-sigma regulatory factor
MTSSSGGISKNKVSRDKVLARRAGDEVCFLVVGRATASHSPALREYAENALSAGATQVQIDLRDCTHCDSTFLGTLVGLRKAFAGHGCEAIRLVRPSDAVRHILAQMCADRLFSIVEKAASANCDTTWEQLEEDCGRAQPFRFKQTVAEAHQALAGANPALAERFGPLAEAMQQELANDGLAKRS